MIAFLKFALFVYLWSAAAGVTANVKPPPPWSSNEEIPGNQTKALVAAMEKDIRKAALNLFLKDPAKYHEVQAQLKDAPVIPLGVRMMVTNAIFVFTKVQIADYIFHVWLEDDFVYDSPSVMGISLPKSPSDPIETSAKAYLRSA